MQGYHIISAHSRVLPTQACSSRHLVFGPCTFFISLPPPPLQLPPFCCLFLFLIILVSQLVEISWVLILSCEIFIIASISMSHKHDSYISWVTYKYMELDRSQKHILVTEQKLSPGEEVEFLILGFYLDGCVFFQTTGDF